MNAILELFSSPAWDHFVHALLHSLWLGAFWGFALAAGLRAAGPNPQRRYCLSLAALAALMLSTFVAWTIPSVEWTAPSSAVEAPATAIQASHAPTLAATRTGSPEAPATSRGSMAWTAAAAAIWLAGLIVMLTRLTAQLVEIHRVSKTSEAIADKGPTQVLEQLKSALGLERVVRLASSALVQVPCVIGIFSPVILVPASMVAGLPTEQLRAVLAHELAHIRRHDFLLNILQQLVEALLFFNPAVWWINRQIRLEREACCDALAVAALPEKTCYARALLEAAESLGRRGPLLQPAFPGDRQSSTLLERMRRLLAPGYQPLVRLPWPSFLAVMLLSGLLLAGLWRGSQFAVAFAAEILTAEQRIQKIAELKAEHAPDLEDRKYTAADKITVSGRIRTADGKQLDRWPHVSVQSIRPGYDYGGGAHPREDGTFKTTVEFGRVYLGVAHADYAPAFLGPLTIEPGGSITNVDLVLKPGFPAAIRVLDAEDNPISGVKLTGRYDRPASWFPLNLETDAKGLAHVTNALELPMIWTALAPGFSAAELKDVRLNEDQALVWRLDRAEPAQGTVIDRLTGQPISGAAVKLVYRGPTHRHFNLQLEYAPLLATTDERGSFALDSLVHDAEHIIAIEASGHAPKFVHEVNAGQTIPPIELGPPIVLAGEIRGDLSQLAKTPDPVIYLTQPLELGNTSHSHQITVPVTVENGLGRFRIDTLREGIAQITAGAHRSEYRMGDSKTNLVIELSPSSPNANTPRMVTIRFHAVPDAPPVRGVLHARSWNDSGGEKLALPVSNNQATMQVVTPTSISCEATGLTGYWFPEQRISIEPGTDEFFIDLDVLPAGAIHGEVHDHDGSEVSGVMISVIEVQPSPLKKMPGQLGDLGKNHASSNDGPARFMIQPLPLGGEYLLVAHRGNQFAIGEKILLGSDNPIREASLKLAKGRSISGKVVDVSGKPLPRVTIRPNYGTPFGHGFGLSEVLTGSNGEFTVDDLTPELPGEYLLVIDGEPGFQPARVPIDFRRDSMEIQLQPGLELTGVVLHQETGLPLAGAEVYAVPVNPTGGGPFLDADEKTDASGTFRFTKLSDRPYEIGTRSGTAPRVTARPNQREPVILRIQPHPWVRFEGTN